MTPGARIAAVIELLEAVARIDPPIESAVERFLRARRYMGSKDRRSVTERFYGILRRRRRLDWWLGRAGWPGEPTSRARVLADLALDPERRPATLDELFTGAQHAAPRLDDSERAVAAALDGQRLGHSDMPDAVALEYPDWLDAKLRSAFGDRLAEEMTALNQPAPVDLRVNTLLANRADAARALETEGIVGAPTPMSGLGLRVEGRPNLAGSRAFREGLVEVQDEGSQIIAQLACVRPGMNVVDFCAGAGGKTLALAAALGQGGRMRGRLWACDVEARFLEKLTARATRAGAAGIRRHVLYGDEDRWLDENAGHMDRVLADAPCSGTGTWRRHPGAKDWLTPERLAELVARQEAVLADAARLVRPGGWLVYATCSVLPEENGERIAAFLETHPAFRPLPVVEVWTQAVGGPCPADGDFLHLTPARTGTDGFFCAILSRR